MKARVIASIIAVLAAASLLLLMPSDALSQTSNLALNQPTSSSSDESSSLTPDNAVDGDTASRWSSEFSDPQWIQVDLGGTYDIDRIVLNWETAYGSAYQIQVSSNGSSWTTIYSTSSGNGGTDDLSVSGSGRYVRMYGTSRGTEWGYSLYEFQVYGEGGATPTDTPPSGQQPYGGSPWSVPGTIQAENYDEGGSGVAYSDSDSSNSGGAYRSDGVDIESTSDSGGGYNVGWIENGEWLEYTIDVGSSGTHYVEARVASLRAGGTMHVEIDGANVTGAMSFGATGDWQDWTTVASDDFYLSSGEHVMRVSMDSSSFNVNWINVVRGTAPTPTPTPTPPSGWTLVWSEEFDGSGLPDTSDWNIILWEPGTVNDERQKYTNRTENLRIENGYLVIEARNDWWNGYEITSGRIESWQGWSPAGNTAVRFEARVRMPSGGGSWPAFWLLGDVTGWPSCGEIDIVEYVGNNPNWYHSAIHVGSGTNMWVGGTTVWNSETQFHVIGADLYNDRVEFYVDGDYYGTYWPSSNDWGHFPFNKDGNEMHVILNLAMGGMMGGSIDYGAFPFYFEVDYVRVYER